MKRLILSAVILAALAGSALLVPPAGILAGAICGAGCGSMSYVLD